MRCARRALRFRALGCTATDHGHPTARTADLSATEAAQLFDQHLAGNPEDTETAELFRAQMLTEMARMSLEDGLVMQIHPGSTSATTTARSMSDTAATLAADIPRPTNYVDALRPLLDRFRQREQR